MIGMALLSKSSTHFRALCIRLQSAITSLEGQDVVYPAIISINDGRTVEDDGRLDRVH